MTHGENNRGKATGKGVDIGWDTKGNDFNNTTFNLWGGSITGHASGNGSGYGDNGAWGNRD